MTTGTVGQRGELLGSGTVDPIGSRSAGCAFPESRKTPVDATAKAGDSPTWWNMVVGQALIDREASTCANAYVVLKDAIAAYAKAQEELDALPESEKPASDEDRNKSILSWSGTNEDVAKSKIREYAARDAAHHKVELSRQKVESCRDEAERTYQVVVRTLAK